MMTLSMALFFQMSINLLYLLTLSFLEDPIDPSHRVSLPIEALIMSTNKSYKNHVLNLNLSESDFNNLIFAIAIYI